MKTHGTRCLAAGTCLAALMILGCSGGNGPAQTQAVGPAPVQVPQAPAVAMATPGPGAVVASAPVAAPGSWTDMERLTYDQRSAFLTALSGLVAKLDGQIGALNAKRATMTTDTKDWDIAMMDVTAARAYLAGLVSEVSRASPDTWDQEKDRVGAAWQKAEDACDKVRTTTTS